MDSSECDENVFLGELVVLGISGMADNTGRKHRNKFEIHKRAVGNGIKKAGHSSVSGPPTQTQVVQDRRVHTVSYTYDKNHSVIVEYKLDPTKDLFQIGRSSEPQIDFTVVDTCLASSNDINNSADDSNEVCGKCRRKNPRVPMSSTISRYACRLMFDRQPPYTAHVFAAGFDASRNIFLGEKATKWHKKNGEVDGLTTNGILVLNPSWDDENFKEGLEVSRPMYIWHEVSVDGDIYTLRETRSAQARGDLVKNQMNQLKDGTLIDLCGATLLWRTAEGLSNLPTIDELEERLDELNAGKPQCPVNLNTLIIPRRKTVSARSTFSQERQPYVYLSCGHVQGKHAWGHKKEGAGDKHKCPICAAESDLMPKLSLGMEPALHLDSEALNYAFNPCGHMASATTVRFWSRIPLPHGTNSFHPVCPFCTTPLAIEKPFLKLIFQDHCDM